MPRALAADEVQEMVLWIPALPEVASDAASILLQTDCPPMEHAGAVLYEWRQDERFAREHSDAATTVVEFLSLRRSIESWHVPDAIRVLEVAEEARATREGLIRAADALAEAAMSPVATGLAVRLRRGA
jgi:hypothetical protein